MSERPKKKILKFNIQERYSGLGDKAKQLLREKASSKFGYSESQFYRRLVSSSLKADELIFFASAFECDAVELYTRKPPKVESISKMLRKKGVKEFKDMRKMADDLGLGKGQ